MCLSHDRNGLLFAASSVAGEGFWRQEGSPFVWVYQCYNVSFLLMSPIDHTGKSA